jgi:hypothetical protein
VVPEKVEIVARKKMTLRAWFESTLPRDMTKTAYAQLLAEKSGGKIGMSTILNTLKGNRLTSYAKGKAISDLTGGKVPLTEIVASE